MALSSSDNRRGMRLNASRRPPHRRIRPVTAETKNTLGFIQTKLVALNLPQVASWDVEEGIDVSGERALWAWATVKSNNIPIEELAVIRQSVRNVVSKLNTEDNPWVYVRFRDAQ